MLNKLPSELPIKAFNSKHTTSGKEQSQHGPTVTPETPVSETDQYEAQRSVEGAGTIQTYNETETSSRTESASQYAAAQSSVSVVHTQKRFVTDLTTVGKISRLPITPSDTLLTYETLSYMYTNAQGLFNKLSELKSRQPSMPMDLIMITETWLSAEITDAEISLPEMPVMRNYRHSKGGGVIVHYRSDQYFQPVDDSGVQVVDSI